jgi:hypothetical protein
MHRLQELFATSAGEQSFDARLQALFEGNDFDAAEALLADELATMDSRIATLCRELPREAASLSGWEDLVEALELNEGDPVTGITLAIANDPDLAFEKGRTQEPFVTIGLHTDESYPFSSAPLADLMAEATAPSGAAWVGHEEDVELYLEASGFGALNTALLDHPQRHFFRDGSVGSAPLDYVDYVIGCWWRALRFQQAIAAEHAQLGVLGGIPVVAGMAEMRPQVACVHKSAASAAPVARRAAAAERTAEMRPELASILTTRTFAPLILPRPDAMDMRAEGHTEVPSLLKQRTPIIPSAPVEEPVATADETQPVLAVADAPEPVALAVELDAEAAEEFPSALAIEPTPEPSEPVLELPAEAAETVAEVEPALATEPTPEPSEPVLELHAEAAETTDEVQPALAIEPTPEPFEPVLELHAEVAEAAEEEQPALAIEATPEPSESVLELHAEAAETTAEEQPEVPAEPMLPTFAPALELDPEVGAETEAETAESTEEAPPEFASLLTLRASAVERHTEAAEVADEKRPEIVSLLTPDAPEALAAESAEPETVAEISPADSVEPAEVVDIAAAPAIARKLPEEIKVAPTGTGLRRRLAEAEFANDTGAEKVGFLRRLFFWSRPLDKAA